MKSRTSCFNGGVFRKDITRFFPVWVLYTVGLMLIVILGITNAYESAARVRNMADLIQAVVLINFAYAFLVAVLLFGDLFKSRLCNAIHALPLRRETLYLTHLASGLSFALIPEGVVSLLAMPFLWEYWYFGLYFLAAGALSFLLFYGIAAFSCQCAGQIPAAGLVYLMVNFLSCLVYFTINQLYGDQLYGVILNIDPFLPFAPLANLMNRELVEVNVAWETGEPVIREIILHGWGYLGICAGAGVAFAGLGLLLYRRRQLESAGDFLVFKALNPVFLVVYTVTAGTVLKMLCEVLFDTPGLPFLFLGLALGFFTGLMLLGRTTRVFGKKAWAGFGVLTGVLALSLLLARWDAFGIVRWTPDPEDVKSVTIGNGSEYGYYNNGGLKLTGEAEIADAIAMHECGIRQKNAHGWADTYDLRIEYTLKNGSTVTRLYEIPAQSEEGRIYADYMSRPEAILGTGDVDTLLAECTGIFLDIYIPEWILERGDGVTYDSYPVPKEDYRSFLEAMMADCEAGNLSQDYKTSESGAEVMSISLERVADGHYRGCHLVVQENCENLRQWLLEHYPVKE